MRGLPCIINIQLPAKTISFRALACANTRPDEAPYRFTIFGTDNITALGHCSLTNLPKNLRQLSKLVETKFLPWLRYTTPWQDEIQNITFSPFDCDTATNQ